MPVSVQFRSTYRLLVESRMAGSRHFSFRLQLSWIEVTLRVAPHSAAKRQ